MSADSEQQTIRYLIARVGLDGHDRGAHVVSRALRGVGFEVTYSGLHHIPDEITRATVQENVDVLGISILSDTHSTLIPKVMAGPEEYDAPDDALVIVDDITPEEDRPGLPEEGVDAIFSPGTPMQETIDFVREHVPERP